MIYQIYLEQWLDKIWNWKLNVNIKMGSYGSLDKADSNKSQRWLIDRYLYWIIDS